MAGVNYAKEEVAEIIIDDPKEVAENETKMDDRSSKELHGKSDKVEPDDDRCRKSKSKNWWTGVSQFFKINKPNDKFHETPINDLKGNEPVPECSTADTRNESSSNKFEIVIESKVQEATTSDLSRNEIEMPGIIKLKRTNLPRFFIVPWKSYPSENEARVRAEGLVSENGELISKAHGNRKVTKFTKFEASTVYR